MKIPSHPVTSALHYFMQVMPATIKLSLLYECNAFYRHSSVRPYRPSAVTEKA
jgi:hypothetical protein